MRVGPGSKVTFTRHINGLEFVVITRDGDDCSVQDPRGRVLRNVPVEDLQLAGDQEVTERINMAPAWREADGF